MMKHLSEHRIEAILSTLDSKLNTMNYYHWLSSHDHEGQRIRSPRYSSLINRLYGIDSTADFNLSKLCEMIARGDILLFKQVGTQSVIKLIQLLSQDGLINNDVYSVFLRMYDNT